MAAFVLLHGFAQTSASWDEVARALQARGHRTYVPDLYGRLGRGAVSSMGAVCGYVAEVVRTVAAVEGAPVLVGYSMGGRVAVETLMRCPDLPLAGLVLESAGLGPADEASRAVLADRNEQWAARLRAQGVDAFMDWWETLPLFTTQRSLPPETRAAVLAERTAHGAEALAQSLEAWGAQHQAAEADTLAALMRAHDAGVPVLYIAGERDAKYRAVANRTHAVGVPAVIVPNAGHNVHLEEPDVFFKRLKCFLA